MEPYIPESLPVTDFDHPLVRSIRETGIVKVLREASGQISAVFAFTELLNISEGREVA